MNVHEMKARAHIALLLAATMLACDQTIDHGDGPDGGPLDASDVADATVPDAVSPDAVSPDASSPDVGTDSGIAAGPIFLPCPDDRWAELRDDDGRPFCEPFVRGSPVELTQCPDGWHEITEADVRYCSPYVDDTPEDCGPYEAHFPGTPGCEPIGDPCSRGDFAPGLPSTGVVFVSAGATGGDGTRERPFGSLEEVPTSTLTAGQTIALGAGTYEGPLSVPDGVSLWGKCVAETLIELGDRPVPQGDGVVNIEGAAPWVRNLSISGASERGLTIHGDGAVNVRGIVVRDGSEGGIHDFSEGDLTIEDVVLRAVAGPALLVQRADVSVRRAVFENIRGNAISIESTGGSIEDTAIVGARRSEEPRGGVLVEFFGARLQMERIWLQDNQIGIGRGPRDNVRLVDVVMLDTGLEGPDEIAIVTDEVRRLRIERTDGIALAASVGENVFIRDTWGSAAIVGGQLTGLHVERSARVGLRDPISVKDALIRATGADGSGAGEASPMDGVAVVTENSTILTRVLIEDARTAGILAHGQLEGIDTTVGLADVVIRNVRESADGHRGYGIVATGDDLDDFAFCYPTCTVGLRASDLRIEDVATAGILATKDAELELWDFWIKNVRAPGCAESQQPCRFVTAGIASELGAGVDIRESSLIDAGAVGLWVGEGAAADVRSTRIRGVGTAASIPMNFDAQRVLGDAVVVEGVDVEVETRPDSEDPGLGCFPSVEDRPYEDFIDVDCGL
jgi:hypothetical protein